MRSLGRRGHVRSTDSARFAELYQSYNRHIYAYCRRRCSADVVDDVVAEVFLTVWRKISHSPEGDDALRWMYRIAYLVLTNHWRGAGRRKKLAEKLSTIGMEPAPLIADQLVVRDEVREVLEAARQLRAEDQELLRLSLWEHLSMEEIGTILGVSANTAKQRLHRARKRLVREHQRLIGNTTAASPVAPEGGEA